MLHTNVIAALERWVFDKSRHSYLQWDELHNETVMKGMWHAGVDKEMTCHFKCHFNATFSPITGYAPDEARDGQTLQ